MEQFLPQRFCVERVDQGAALQSPVSTLRNSPHFSTREDIKCARGLSMQVGARYEHG